MLQEMFSFGGPWMARITYTSMPDSLLHSRKARNRAGLERKVNIPDWDRILPNFSNCNVSF
uniref:Uncharacterized protein n=1 Tax=Rhizophora mucronata TaxID=61149 RepID=A0A2P2NV12_RHIMU